MLQFVSLSTRSINYHQFSFILETPLRHLELRAENQEALEKWSDAILAAQEKEEAVFSKGVSLNPRGMWMCDVASSSLGLSMLAGTAEGHAQTIDGKRLRHDGKTSQPCGRHRSTPDKLQ